MSAMDGYAIRSGEKGATLTVVGEAPAGRAFERDIIDGEALRIFTGGPGPGGGAGARGRGSDLDARQHPDPRWNAGR